MAARLPGLDPAPVNEASCLYTWTANEDFILDRPGGGPFVIASPCSGHGAKFAPLLGEIIADLAAGPPRPATRASPSPRPPGRDGWSPVRRDARSPVATRSRLGAR